MSTSGASISVLKTAEPGPVLDRLEAQAVWLRKHEHTNIVKVLNIREDGYEMELLDQTGPVSVSPAVILGMLEAAVWNQSADASEWFNPGACEEYVGGLVRGDQLLEWLATFDTFGFCDSHGDPTRENVLWRGHHVPVLTDPLPDVVWGGRLPSCRALDIGKIIQSLVGYESVKAGRLNLGTTWQWPAFEVRDLRARCRNDNEWNLSLCFACIHVARLIPYQSPEHQVLWNRWLPEMIGYLCGV